RGPLGATGRHGEPRRRRRHRERVSAQLLLPTVERLDDAGRPRLPCVLVDALVRPPPGRQARSRPVDGLLEAPVLGLLRVVGGLPGLAVPRTTRAPAVPASAVEAWAAVR